MGRESFTAEHWHEFVQDSASRVFEEWLGEWERYATEQLPYREDLMPVPRVKTWIMRLDRIAIGHIVSSDWYRSWEGQEIGIRACGILPQAAFVLEVYARLYRSDVIENYRRHRTATFVCLAKQRIVESVLTLREAHYGTYFRKKSHQPEREQLR